MALRTETITVDFPIGEVFDFLADGSRNALWRPDVVSVIFASGPADRAVWAQSVRTASGRIRKADYRITWYDRPGRLELAVVAGWIRPVTVFELKSLSPTSTRLTCTVEVNPLWYPFAHSRLGGKDADVELANLNNVRSAMAARA